MRADVGGRRRDILICLILVALTLAAYAPVRNYPFVDYDDPAYVASNAMVTGGLTAEGARWAVTSVVASNWHPLTWLSLMLDCTLFGVAPGPMHIHNVMLHAANACLLFWVLRRLTGTTWRSAIVAALFAWHPLRVESVAWIAERKDVLSTLFALLTLWAWLRFTEQRTVWRYGLALLLFALALMAKPMVVTLPCLLLLLDFWPLQRGVTSAPPASATTRAGRTAAPAPWRTLLLEKVPFFAVALATGVVTLYAQRVGGSMTVGDRLSVPQRATNAIVACAEYLRKFLWPDDLAVFYPHPGWWPWWRIGAAAGVLALVTVLALRQRRTRPYLLTGWLWYVITLLPTVGLVQVGGQAFADRYTYLPMIGIAIMVVWGIADLAARWRVPAIARLTLAGAAVAACLLLTALQVHHWQDTLTLFRRALEVTRDNYRAHKEVADVYRARKQFAEADRHYAEAVRIKPGFFIGQMDYGLSLGQQGNHQAALVHFLAATQINPNSAEAQSNLATAYELIGDLDNAVAHYREAVRLQPTNRAAQRRLNDLLRHQQLQGLGALTP